MRGVRLTLSIARTTPLADKLILNPRKNDNMDDAYWLSDQDPDTLTDEVLEKWLRGNVQTLYHPVNSMSNH